MLIRTIAPSAVKSSEITPESVYRNRRQFLAEMGITAVGLMATACGKTSEAPPASAPQAATANDDSGGLLSITQRSEQASGETVTPPQTVSQYNNYYEFGTAKDEPAKYARTLKTRPWTVKVSGECDLPGIVDLDELIKPHALEERIYRHRCVETWSIVVPWAGFPLADLIARFKPNSRAKFVAFETLYDPEQMPRARFSGLKLPYVEGLRIDEAMHPLAFLSVGMYGAVMPNQNGAPLRLTLPWKYGYKSIKSIVAIRFVEEQPPTTWSALSPNEYGFYSNVNPKVEHPRWSQAEERRLGELFKRPTLMFNGYPEVASLYTGMDLKQNY